MTPPVTGLARPTRSTGSLSEALSGAFTGAPLSDVLVRAPRDRRDRFLTLLAIYDLHTAPLEVVGDAARLQGHPVIAELKYRLEADWLAELELAWVEAGQLS